MSDRQVSESSEDVARWGRDSTAFGRVTGLSDGVFAIAMTLLVFTLAAPTVSDERLAAALVDQLPQLLTTMLSFALVANLWWQHHRFFDRLGTLEPGLVAINLVLLGAVALVPFPTSLIGAAPTAQAAVLPFIGLFVVLSVLYLLLLVRATVANAWDRPMRTELVYWLAAGWVSGIVVMLVAMGVALWLPVAGLAILAVTVALGPVSARFSRRQLPFSEIRTSDARGDDD